MTEEKVHRKRNDASMNSITLLKEYVSQLIRRVSVVATGIVGLLITFVIDSLLPNVFQPVGLYLIIFVAGLVFGGYFIFSDLVKELNAKDIEFERKENKYKHTVRQLEHRISELENAQPRIVVGFQDGDGNLLRRLQIRLIPLPPKPNFDELVEEKRSQLLEKKQRRKSSPDMVTTLEAVLFEPNLHYEEDVEQYLIEYRAYLLRRWECRVARDRTKSLTPIVDNRGQAPARDVAIEFEMPTAYREPAKHQRRDFPPDVMLEEPPMRFEIYVCEPPQEPKAFTKRLGYNSLLPSADVGFSAYSDLDSVMDSISSLGTNTDGPYYETQDGTHYVTYEIKQLVQHRPEDDFEPIWLWLGHIEHPVTWTIPVRITSADLREPQEEHLVLEFTVAEKAEEGWLVPANKSKE